MLPVTFDQLTKPSSLQAQRHLFSNTKRIRQADNNSRLDEGLALKVVGLEPFYDGQFTLSTQLTKPNYLVKKNSDPKVTALLA